MRVVQASLAQPLDRAFFVQVQARELVAWDGLAG